MKEDPTYPIRINKYLAQKGYSSRRGADELIEKRLITLNGRVAVLGDLVQEGDEVLVETKKALEFIYASYYKPKGEIKDTLVVDKVVLYVVDQLEKDVSGVVLFTNDRRVASRINDVRYEHEREYIVRTRENLRPNLEQKLLDGIHIESEKELIQANAVERIEERMFAMVLTKNKQHLVKRIVVALFNEATEIERVRVANITTERIALGGIHKLTREEKETLLASLGLDTQN